MRWREGIHVGMDPDDILSWRWDFTDWLSAGQTVSAHSVTAATGIDVDSSIDDPTGVTVVLSVSGSPGNEYPVTVRVTASDGQVTDRTVVFFIKEL